MGFILYIRTSLIKYTELHNKFKLTFSSNTYGIFPKYWPSTKASKRRLKFQKSRSNKLYYPTTLQHLNRKMANNILSLAKILHSRVIVQLEETVRNVMKYYSWRPTDQEWWDADKRTTGKLCFWRQLKTSSKNKRTNLSTQKDTRHAVNPKKKERLKGQKSLK